MFPVETFTTSMLRASVLLSVWVATPVLAQLPSASVQPTVPSADEIVQKCDTKYAGDDQWTTMTVVNRNKDGAERKAVYKRMVKNYAGQAGLVSQKMILVTEFPPSERDFAFMRVEYLPDADKVPEQWLYAPDSKALRRVAERDPTLSFLGSTLTLGDITQRAADHDTHRLIGVDRSFSGEAWLIESVPKKADPQYSKRISRFTKTPSWDTCVKEQVVYYDRKGIKLKVQDIKWQQVDGAWLWSHVDVVNTQDQRASVFDITDVRINTQLEEGLFTDRTLKRGLKGLPKR